MLKLFVFCVCILTGCTLFAQNMQPVIANLRVSNDKNRRQLHISFDLKGKKEDSITVSFRVLAQQGTPLTIEGRSLSGDYGHPLSPGNRKKITWNYKNTDTGKIQVELVASGAETSTISCLANRVDSTRIKETIKKIVGIRNTVTGPGHLEEVKKIITCLFEENGLRVTTQQFTANGYKGTNIIAHLPGSGNPDKRYLVTAHFDTVNDSPGADDNASGIAGLIEIATVLSASGLASGVDFIAFDLEEKGLYGSQHYITMQNREEFRVMGVFNFDMIGFFSTKPGSQHLPEDVCGFFPDICTLIKEDSSRGNFVLLIANDSSRTLSEVFARSAKEYTPALKQFSLVASPEAIRALPGIADSDQKSFWLHNDKAIHIGDGGPTRNPNYHSPGDTPSTLNFSFISDIVKATVASIALLAGMQPGTLCKRTVNLND